MWQPMIAAIMTAAMIAWKILFNAKDDVHIIEEGTEYPIPKDLNLEKLKVELNRMKYNSAQFIILIIAELAPILNLILANIMENSK